ncbi:MAG: metallophosphoesterase [Treponema sp.]|nr:metallophosphoesterase [Treponema sp.]
MKKLNDIAFRIVLSLTLVLPLSCYYAPSEYFNRSPSVDKRAPEIKELNDTPTENVKSTLGTSYDILVLTDIHFGHKVDARHDDDVVDWLESLGTKPKFCVNLGDTADHGEMNEFNDWLTNLESGIKDKINAPVYSVIGNHDLRRNGWESFKTNIYPYTSCYHFESTGMSYYFLDTADGTLGKQQLKNLEEAFKADTKPKVVFSHEPIYHDKSNLLSATALQDTHEADRIFTIFARNNVLLYLCGHSHAFRNNNYGSFTEYNLPSYLHSRAWGLIHIDETTGTATPELISVDE